MKAVMDGSTSCANALGNFAGSTRRKPPLGGNNGAPASPGGTRRELVDGLSDLWRESGNIDELANLRIASGFGDDGTAIRVARQNDRLSRLAYDLPRCLDITVERCSRVLD